MRRGPVALAARQGESDAVIVSTMRLLPMLAICASVLAQPADTRQIALRVIDLDMRRQESTATSATIDSLLTLYSDSVVYEHPNAGAVVRGKETMRSAMGGYIGSIRRVRNLMPPRVTVGNHVAIVETSVQMETRDGDTWRAVTRHGIKIIELDSRYLVRRIIDYPW
jgi:hypothetical protein